MPTFTPAAFAAELAAERCDAIASVHRLITHLDGQSSAVIAGALAGLTGEAQSERDRLRAEVDAETKAKNERPPAKRKKASAPAPAADPLPERAAASELA